MNQHNCTNCKTGESGKPIACTPKCRKTPEFISLLSEWRLATRGYPSGYSSMVQYERCKPATAHCANCGESFLKKPSSNERGCSVGCREKLRVQSIANTKQERYGSTGYNNRAQAEKTSLSKYGTTNPFQSPVVQEKWAATNIGRYGKPEGRINEPLSKERRQAALLRKYGTSEVIGNVAYMKKVMQERYGVSNPQQIPSVNQKTMATRVERYGTDLVGAVVKSSAERTNLAKYGAPYFFGSEVGNMSYKNLVKNYDYTEEALTELSQQKASCTLGSYILKYGDTETAFDEYQKRLAKCDSMSYTWALGVANGDAVAASDIFVNRITTRMASHQAGRASKQSMGVFLPVVAFAKQAGISEQDIFIGYDSSSEWFIYDAEIRKVRFYDLTIKSLKLMVEFHGVHYHPRTPDQPPSFTIPCPPSKFADDERKRQLAEMNGFDLITIWSDNPEKENIETVVSKIQEKTNGTKKL